MADCYKCKNRGNLAGSCHSQCNKGVKGLFEGGVEMPTVQGNEHGIKNGWFFWPFNYDPVWLQSCNSFEEKS